VDQVVYCERDVVQPESRTTTGAERRPSSRTPDHLNGSLPKVPAQRVRCVTNKAWVGGGEECNNAGSNRAPRPVVVERAEVVEKSDEATVCAEHDDCKRSKGCWQYAPRLLPSIAFVKSGSRVQALSSPNARQRCGHVQRKANEGIEQSFKTNDKSRAPREKRRQRHYDTAENAEWARVEY